MLRRQCLRYHEVKRSCHTDAEHGEKKINFWEGPTRISEWKEEQVHKAFHALMLAKDIFECMLLIFVPLHQCPCMLGAQYVVGHGCLVHLMNSVAVPIPMMQPVSTSCNDSRAPGSLAAAAFTKATSPLEGSLLCADCTWRAVSMGDWHLHSHQGVWWEEGGASCCSFVRDGNG